MRKIKALRQQAAVARDISYANSAQTRSGRVFIRTVETLSGRQRLIRRAQGYELEVAQGADFWQVMIDRYGIKLEFQSGGLAAIPKTGPLVVISNHPFGILDGLVLGHLLSQSRGDFRVIAHKIFRKAEDLDRIILPISFDETREAMKINLETRREAVTYLNQGGCIGIFPGGTVSTAARPMGRALDPMWRNFTAKMIQKSDAVVLPLFFHGHNSRLFQLASHAHYTLRMALLIREFKKQIKHTVRLEVGDIIDRAALQPYFNDPTAMMKFLRDQTYGLAPDASTETPFGYEFEAQYR